MRKISHRCSPLSMMLNSGTTCFVCVKMQAINHVIQLYLKTQCYILELVTVTELQRISSSNALIYGHYKQSDKIRVCTHKWRNLRIHTLQPLVISDKLEMQPETIFTVRHINRCHRTFSGVSMNSRNICFVGIDRGKRRDQNLVRKPNECVQLIFIISCH